MSRADCTDYFHEMCPKGADKVNEFGKKTLDFVTFGCWGVYYLDGEMTFGKKMKTYGGESVAKGLTKFTEHVPSILLLLRETIYTLGP